MKKMEDAAELRYIRLGNTPNPASVLCELYRDIFGVQTGHAEIIMFNKLIKIYGRFTVFFALMDLANKSRLDNPYAYINFMCKTRLERQHRVSDNLEIDNLDKQIKRIDKAIEEQKEAGLEIKELEDE